MKIEIWDDHNKQWLEPITIFFGKDNTIWRVTACKVGEDPLSDGWYDLQGEDLKKIAIVGDLNWNLNLLNLTFEGKFCDGYGNTILGCECKNDSHYSDNKEQKCMDDTLSSPKIRVHYATEFGVEITTLELNELSSFMKKFKVLSLKWE